MRAQKPAIRQIKSVLVIARRVIGRSVKRVKAMPLGFNIRAVRDGESHAPENADRTVDQLCQRMNPSPCGRDSGQGDVDFRQGAAFLLCAQIGKPGFNGRRHIRSQGIERLTYGGFFLLWHLPHPLAEQGNGAGAPEEFYAGGVHGRQIRGIGNGRKRLGAKLFDLGDHDGITGKQPSRAAWRAGWIENPG